ncbi:MAG: hypothetical protein NW207_00640 [Cytophagales bacterium]|nr:hypothetical protein [Cytophagales bacterium]
MVTDIVFDFIKILLPAAMVLYAVFLVVKSFLNKEYEKKLIDIKLKNTDIILPIRLQAYERVVMLLERISPNNLLLRVSDPHMTCSQLHQKLVQEIRSELNHNLSQQVYMSDEAWNLVKKGIEDIIIIVNTSSELVDPNARGIELAKKMVENILQKNTDPIMPALTYVKNEIRSVF